MKKYWWVVVLLGAFLILVVAAGGVALVGFRQGWLTFKPPPGPAIQHRHTLTAGPAGDTGSCVVFSPDSKTLVSAGHRDRLLRWWDMGTGQCVKTAGEGSEVAFSPDGKTLVAASGPSLHLYDVATGAEKAIHRGHKGSINRVVFSPDGRTLATAESNALRLWNVEPLQLRSTLTSVRGEAGLSHSGMMAVVWSRDGSLLASLNPDGVILWDARTGEELDTVTTQPVGGLAFSPDGKTVATGRIPSALGFWNVTTRQQTDCLLDMGGNAIEAVAFSPDGNLVACGGEIGVLYFYDAATHEAYASTQAQARWIGRLVFSPDSKLVASVGTGTIEVWDVR